MMLLHSSPIPERVKEQERQRNQHEKGVITIITFPILHMSKLRLRAVK